MLLARRQTPGHKNGKPTNRQGGVERSDYLSSSLLKLCVT